jgi:hypothetical protein
MSWNAKRGVLLSRPADADAQPESAVAYLADRGAAHSGCQQRVAIRQHDHGRTHPLCDAGLVPGPKLGH